MNLQEFAHVDSLYRDLDTGMQVAWNDYLRRIVNKLGFENVTKYIPFGYATLQEKYEEDENFNNTELTEWLYAAGFKSYINCKTQEETIFQLRRGLAAMFTKNGITCFSPSEGVSVLKEAARMMFNEIVKFKFRLDTPYGSRYNEHYAKSEKRAKSVINQWNEEFIDTGYCVTFISATKMPRENMPRGYTCW